VNFYQGLLLVNQGQPEQAEKWYRNASRFDPGFALARANLGLLLMNQQRYEEALSEFDAALASTPWDVFVGFNRGLTLERLKRNSAAIEQYRRVLQLQPEHPQSRARLAELLASQGELHKPSQ
jgi:tetratricopeptide (TPR) repeat protein